MRDYANLIQRLRERCLPNGFGYLTPAQRDMEEAANAIEELLAATPKWIRVEERLPECSQKCFVYTKRGDYGGYNITYFSALTLTFLSYEGKTEKVTHWMPLPEPPEEEML